MRLRRFAMKSDASRFVFYSNQDPFEGVFRAGYASFGEKRRPHLRKEARRGCFALPFDLELHSFGTGH